MKAVLDKDRIINWHRDGTVDVVMPRGIGEDRIRVVNGKAIDLATLSQMWVERINGVWILHAKEYPGCQLVNMTWRDRKKLISDNGVYRIKTQQEIDDENYQAEQEKIDNQELRQNLKTLVQNLKFGQVDQHIENVFGQLNAAQKASLKALYKTVLYLAKNR